MSVVISQIKELQCALHTFCPRFLLIADYKQQCALMRLSYNITLSNDRKFYLSIESVEHDYLPTSHNSLTQESRADHDAQFFKIRLTSDYLLI
jgi:hypothetical protein